MSVEDYTQKFKQSSLLDIATQCNIRERDDNALLERANNDDELHGFRKTLTENMNTRADEAMRKEAISMLKEANTEIATYMIHGKINAKRLLENDKYKKLLVFGTQKSFDLQKTFEAYVNKLIENVNRG